MAMCSLLFFGLIPFLEGVYGSVVGQTACFVASGRQFKRSL